VIWLVRCILLSVTRSLVSLVFFKISFDGACLLVLWKLFYRYRIRSTRLHTTNVSAHVLILLCMCPHMSSCYYICVFPTIYVRRLTRKCVVLAPILVVYTCVQEYTSYEDTSIEMSVKMRQCAFCLLAWWHAFWHAHAVLAC
jgi:hypothetical protein